MASVDREVRYCQRGFSVHSVWGLYDNTGLLTQVIGNYTAAFREDTVSRVRNPALASRPSVGGMETSSLQAGFCPASLGSMLAEEMKGGMQGMDGVPCPPVCFWVGLLYKPVGFSFMHPGITLLALWMWHTGIIEN